jgi:hypothetical protein
VSPAGGGFRCYTEILGISYQLIRILTVSVCVLAVQAQSVLKPPPGKISLLLFTLTDCPIAGRLAPEFRRICAEYKARGVTCTLVYVDADTTLEQVGQHQKGFSLESIPFVVDAADSRILGRSDSVRGDADFQRADRADHLHQLHAVPPAGRGGAVSVHEL